MGETRQAKAASRLAMAARALRRGNKWGCCQLLRFAVRHLQQVDVEE